MPSVHYNALIDSSAKRLWNLLKQFGCISQWYPAISESYIEDSQPDGLAGSIRRLNLENGATLRERLLAMDHSQLSFSYCF